MYQQQTHASPRRALREAGIVAVTGALFLLSAMALAAGSGFTPAKGSVESAPRYALAFTGKPSQGWDLASIPADMRLAASWLVADSTDSAAGIELYQPRGEASAVGTSSLGEALIVSMGGQDITRGFVQSVRESSYSFTSDADDHLMEADIGRVRILGSETDGSAAELPAVSNVAQQGNYTRKAPLNTSRCDC